MWLCTSSSAPMSSALGLPVSSSQPVRWTPIKEIRNVNDPLTCEIGAQGNEGLTISYVILVSQFEGPMQ